MEEEERQGGILGWIEANPLIAIVIAIAASIVLFAFISNRPNNQRALSDGDEFGDLSGLDEDEFGNKIIYLPVENYFNNISEISGSYNSPISTNSHNTTTSHTSITNTPPPAPPPPVVQPPPVDLTRGKWVARHTVRRGETLKSLANNFRHLGIQITAEDLYSHNRHNIESTAQGHHDRPNGANTKIYPGQVLSVPSLGTYWSNKNRRYEAPGTPPYPAIPAGGIG